MIRGGFAMTIKAHFDGKVLVPDEPVKLEEGQKVSLEISPLEPPAPGTAGDLLEVVLSDDSWAKRDDIGDSTEFVNELRRKIERREL
jgi:hypothetical protein